MDFKQLNSEIFKEDNNAPITDTAESLDFASLNEMIENQKNPLTGEQRPLFANGATASRPIKESPLSVEERLKISLGDEKGKQEYLASKFEAVEKNKEGNYLVKNKGLWYEVDPSGNSIDPWEASKKLIEKGDATDLKTFAAEALSDVADIAPELGMAAASIGAGILTGGTSLVAQAAALGATGAGASLLKSSLGKLSGTYSGDAVDQLEEASLEMLLNLGGVAIVPGAKATMQLASKSTVGQALGGMLSTAGKTFSKVASKAGTLADESFEVLADFIGAGSKIDSNNIFRYMKRPKEVVSIFNQAFKGGRAGDEEAVVNFMRQAKTNRALSLAQSTRQALSSMWDKTSKEIIDAAPKNLKLQSGQPVSDVINLFREQGLVKKVKKGIFKAADINTVKRLANSAQSSELVTDLATNPKTYREFKSFIEAIAPLSRPKLSYGKQAVKDLMDIDKKAQNIIKNRIIAANKSTEVMPSLTKALQSAKKALVSNVERQVRANPSLMNKQGMSFIDSYSNLRQNYAKVAGSVEDLLDLNALAQGRGRDLYSSQAMEKASMLTEKLVNSYGKRGVQPDSLGAAVNQLNQYNKNIGRMVDSIRDINTAEAFVPKLRTSFVQFGPVFAATGAATGALTGQDAGSAGAGAVAGLALAAATSPRTLFTALRTYNKVSGKTSSAAQIVNKSMHKARQLIMSLPANKREELLINKNLIGGISQGIVRAGETALQNEISVEEMQ